MTAWEWVAGALGLALGFMMREYFRRVERHMGRLHKFNGWFAHLFLRVERVERFVGLAPLPSPLPEAKLKPPTEDI